MRCEQRPTCRILVTKIGDGSVKSQYLKGDFPCFSLQISMHSLWYYGRAATGVNFCFPKTEFTKTAFATLEFAADAPLSWPVV